MIFSNDELHIIVRKKLEIIRFFPIIDEIVGGIKQLRI